MLQSQKAHVRPITPTDYNRFLNGTPLGKIPVISLTAQALRQAIKDQIIDHSLSRKTYKQLHTDISLTKGIYYYNRDSEQAKKTGYYARN